MTGGGPSSASSDATSSTHRLAAHIPSLSRQETSAPSPPTLSVNEQLAEARRNAPTRHPFPAFTVPGPFIRSPYVGFRYIVDVAQKLSDDRDRDREGLLKKALAGPKPPLSWKDSFASQRRKSTPHQDDDADDHDIVDPMQLPNSDARRAILSTWRAIKTSPDPFQRIVKPGPAPLRDLRDCAAAVLAETVYLSDPQAIEGDDDYRWHYYYQYIPEVLETLPKLPAYLRSRLLACMGQEARSPAVVCETLIPSLFAIATDQETESADYADQDWDADSADHHGMDMSDSGKDAVLLEETPAPFTDPYLDLSFARISRKMLLDVIGLNSVIVNLRSLSLAGCHIVSTDQHPSYPQGGMDSPLALTYNSFRQGPLSALVGLESLCLAGCHFLPSKDACQGKFWGGFWGSETSKRIRLLDLSYAHGLNFSAFAASYKGRLRVLVLSGILPPNIKIDNTYSPLYPEIGRALGPWLKPLRKATDGTIMVPERFKTGKEENLVTARELATLMTTDRDAARRTVYAVRQRQWCDVYM